MQGNDQNLLLTVTLAVFFVNLGQRKVTVDTSIHSVLLNETGCFGHATSLYKPWTHKKDTTRCTQNC